MTTDYTPIACGAYDELEVLAMHREAVQVCLHNGEHVQGLACDLSTHDGVEFLLLESAGKGLELRLDKIAEIVSMQGVVVWRQKADKSD